MTIHIIQNNKNTTILYSINKLALIFVCLLIANNCFPQSNNNYRETTVTPMAGMTLSNMTGDHSEDFGWKPGFTVGVELMHRFNNYLGASLGTFRYFSFVLGYRL